MTTALEQVQTRVIPGAEILAVFIDGFVVGSTHVIGAIGVKRTARKWCWACEGVAAHPGGGLLVDLQRSAWPDSPGCRSCSSSTAARRCVCRGRGVWQERGGAAAACRNHKVERAGSLPDKQRAHAKLVLRAAFNLEDASKGIGATVPPDLERGGWSSTAGSRARSGDVLPVWLAGTAAVSDHQLPLRMPPTPARADSPAA